MQNGQIIDCDGHFVEPRDLWERYIDSGLHAKAPQLVADRNGDTQLRLKAGSIRSQRTTARAFLGCRTRGSAAAATAGSIPNRRSRRRPGSPRWIARASILPCRFRRSACTRSMHATPS